MNATTMAHFSTLSLNLVGLNLWKLSQTARPPLYAGQINKQIASMNIPFAIEFVSKSLYPFEHLPHLQHPIPLGIHSQRETQTKRIDF